MKTRDARVGVAAAFEHLDSLLAAIGALRARGFQDLEAFSPVPCHALEHALPERRSPVRYATFSGALAGMAVAFLLTILTALLWDLITGGKPVVSLPPFLVPVFELTVLGGGLATLLAVLHFSRLPARKSAGFDPRFTDDRFGLFVETPASRAGEARAILEEHHAERSWSVSGEAAP
jgi:hypothetical protein